jgi:hypothetical protein
MFPTKSFAILFGLLLVASMFSIIPIAKGQDQQQIAHVGDIGCRKQSIANLKAIADLVLPFIGLGDYLYKCKISDVQTLWDHINPKIGEYGNHDYENANSKNFAKVNFHIDSTGLTSWQNGHVAIFGINTFDKNVKYDTNSAQIKELKGKITVACSDESIWWIEIIHHEPIYTPKVNGGHNANVLLKDTLAPIEQTCDKIIDVSGHNHITAIGKFNGVSIGIFGGGGQGGDKVSKLQGFLWASNAPAFGIFTYTKNQITVKIMAGTTELKTFVFAQKNDIPNPEPDKFGNVTIGNGTVWIPTLNGTLIINATAGILNYTK